MNDNARRDARRALQWPHAAAIGIVAYIGLTVTLVWLGLRQTGGVFVYAQDDPYIHLTIARTLAHSGVWGIRPEEFAGASSSPLWTLLLAGLQRSGAAAEWVPLILNLASGVGVILIGARIIDRSALQRVSVPLLLAIVAVTPLATLAIIGLEHTLFLLFALAFGWRVSEILAGDRPDGVVTSLLCAAMVATRYEGLFLAFAAFALLASRRRITPAVMVAIAAAVPVVAYAAYSFANGGPVLPNSVLMKSGPARFASVAGGVSAVLADWFSIAQLFSRPPQLVLTLATLIGLALGQSTADGRPSRHFAILFVITSVLHACLVKLEWFFRYEAYLIAIGLLAVGLLVLPIELAACADRRRRIPVPVTLLVVLLAIPLAVRALSALAVTPGAMRNVYQQQYQMARFFRGAYPGETIALNDIGAVSWFAPSRIVDVMGLASPDVALLKRQRRFDREAIDGLVRAHGVRAIAMYEGVFAPILPHEWRLVGEWKIAGNVAVSEDTVGFFAASETDAQHLRRALTSFTPSLPAGVQCRVFEPGETVGRFRP